MNPEDRSLERVREIFREAPFIASLGIELLGFGPGWCETMLANPAAHLLQQNGFIHAGVQATLADHTAGAAAASLMQPDQIVLTVEFKVNLLRPAPARPLHCRAEVLRPGRTLSVARSEVRAEGADGKLIAAAMVTLALVSAPGG